MQEQSQDADEISLADVWMFVRRYWRVLLALPVLIALAAVVVSMQLPNQYTANALLLLRSPQGGAAQSSLGPQGAIEVLKGEGVLEKAVERFRLVQKYRVEDARSAKLTLLAKVDAKVTKEGLLSVAVVDEDPVQAAAITNFLAEATRAQILELHVTEHGRSLYALQGLAKGAKLRLDEAARRAEAVVPGGEAGLTGATAQLLSNFATLEAQLTGKNEGGSSPLQSSILQMRSDLEKVNPQIRAMSPAQLAALRELFFERAMLRELQKQVDQEQVLAAQDVQLVLPASEPLAKSGPKRALIVAVSTMAALMLAVLGCLLHQGVGRLQREVRRREAGQPGFVAGH